VNPDSTAHPDAPADDDRGPFDGLDYGGGGSLAGVADRPRTAAIGPLAQAIRELTGCGGLTTLAAAVLIDQGRVTDALTLLSLEISERRAERPGERDGQSARSRGGAQ